MNSGLRRAALVALIVNGVRGYFRECPLDVFFGCVRTEEVIKAVKLRIDLEFPGIFTKNSRGEVFDAIRELGPVGEDDWKWLTLWSDAGRQPTTLQAFPVNIGRGILHDALRSSRESGTGLTASPGRSKL